MQEHRPEVHGVLLLGEVQESETAFGVPTTTRGLLDHFPRGADPPANDRRATTPPVRSPTSLSLRAILATGDGGRGAWARASGRRATREVGRGGSGGDNSEGWSGGGNATSNAMSLLPLSPLHPSLLSPPAPPLPTSIVALRPLALAHAPLARDRARRAGIAMQHWARSRRRSRRNPPR